MLKMNLKETIAENYEDLIRLCISYSTTNLNLKPKNGIAKEERGIV